MIFYFNPDNLLTAVRVKLLTDVTLLGSTMLNGTNKIFTNSLPEDFVLPCITITNQGLVQNAIASEWSGEIRLFCYTAMASNRQIPALGNLILAKCEEILTNDTLTISGMTVQPIKSLGIVSNMFDPETDKHKAKGVLRLWVELGYNI